MRHPIGDNHFVQFYGCNQGLHIMVYEGKAPLTCKKERLKPLRDFISKKEGIAFKGGLKLEKNGGQIYIIAKTIRLGPVQQSIFDEAIASAKRLPYYN